MPAPTGVDAARWDELVTAVGVRGADAWLNSVWAAPRVDEVRSDSTAHARLRSHLESKALPAATLPRALETFLLG